MRQALILLPNQDGWGRMFADATLIMLAPIFKRKDAHRPQDVNTEKDEQPNWWRKLIRSRSKLRNAYAIVIGTIIPLIVFFLVRNPVDILSLAGTVAAVHTPVVVFLTLYLNMKRLPKPLRPGRFSIVLMVLSGLFFTVFAVYHFVTLW
jgi:hypothetical protein